MSRGITITFSQAEAKALLKCIAGDYDGCPNPIPVQTATLKLTGALAIKELER